MARVSGEFAMVFAFATRKCFCANNVAFAIRGSSVIGDSTGRAIGVSGLVMCTLRAG